MSHNDDLQRLARETAEKAYDVAKGGWPFDLEHVILAALRQAQQVQREELQTVLTRYKAAVENWLNTGTKFGPMEVDKKLAVLDEYRLARADADRAVAALRSQEIPK